ncbi:extracellular solute-binding protein [Pseudodonghicola flavimaris]|uniref:Extracellular solute-binding protein n=1 Tax=Pseudodonghicola flavimaris TaxID=3050036 RepID=A0ABT7EVY4_9RHOB|nr:extracellular solute-binding protein [Pseudodonghicola flavimaris]MDK3016502.1 extracellular solute-binding protein [Pseudodonghicola flavimaris]
MSQPPKVTIKDVARAAGCGISTASRVLNNSGPASAEIRDRVERAAREMGFSFSAIGRALQSRRSMTVGCLVPSLANPVFAEAVQGAQEDLQAAGYQLLVASSNYDADRDEDLLRMLLGKEVDGLIATVASPAANPALAQARARALPVALMFHDPLPGFASAYVDNRAAAREVARQFAALGHRRTGFLALRFSSSDRSRNRYDGFRAECRARGLADPVLIELSESDAARPEALARTLAAETGLTAIFASNDFLAIAVQQAARHLGWRVPQDLSVAGFDGIGIGRLLERPLATIETDPEAMGRQAAATLLNAMQGGELQQQPPLPFTFRAGGTLAPPPVERKDDGREAPPTAVCSPRPSQNSTEEDPMKHTLFATAIATAIAGPALAEDAICYNCPPQWADWASMLQAIDTEIGVRMPHDNKNSGQTFAQLVAEKASPVADVAYYGVTTGIKAGKEGLVEAYKPEGFDDIPEGLKDPEGKWFAVHYGTIGFFVNVDALAGAPVPQCFADLTKPEYKGMVGYLDPSSAFVGYAGAVGANLAFGGTLENFDPAIDYFKTLAENDPIVPKQTSFARVVSGEIPILFDYDFNAYRAKYEEDGNFEFVLPCEGSVRVPYVMSLVKNAPHAETGKKVLDFILSDEGQAIWTNAYLQPARPVELPAEVAAKFLPASDYARAQAVNYAEMEKAQSGFGERYLSEVK